MARVLLVVVVLAVAFWIVSIVDCALLPPERHRGVGKSGWVTIVVLLPVIGGALWFIIGRGRTQRASASRAPDDDPEFLGRLGSLSDQDERIRRLEEELAQLDAEDEDPRRTPPADEPSETDTPDPDGDDPRGPRRGAIG